MADHGTRSTYVAGCRCGDCREANRRYQANRRQGDLHDIDRFLDQIADIVAAREQEWRTDAACRTEPVDTFFPARGENRKTDRAAELCATCPVADQCRRYALSLPASERAGIWAGRSVDRRRLSREERQLADLLKVAT
jgi:WhiB family redox-sensing transcriptional regulator